MTARFDAELYLRMLGERELLGDGEHHHHSPPLQGPAAALVAAGVIDPLTAEQVIDDYKAAGELRGEHHHHGPGRRRQPQRPMDLALRRTAILDREIPFASGRLWLRYLALGADASVTRGRSEGQLRFRWARDPLQAPTGRRPFHPHSGALPAVADDRGRTLTVSSGSGGGNDDEWTGTLELTGGLAADAAWLEVEGVRVTLRDAPSAGAVVVEPLDDEPPVARYLWRRIAVGEAPFHRAANIEPALSALFAAGALDPDDPLVGRVRTVAAAMPEHPRHHHHLGGGAGGGRGLAEPWRSLVRRFGRDDGPAGAWVIGAVTPRFDGVQVALLAVVSDATGFEVEFEVTPNVLNDDDLRRPPFAWWARDDRGNHHLGSPNGWGSNEDSANGTLRFWPSLDPRATRLDLMPTAATARAIVPVALDDAAQVTP